MHATSYRGGTENRNSHQISHRLHVNVHQDTSDEALTSRRMQTLSVLSGVDEAPALRADVKRLQRELAELRAEVAALKEARPVEDRMRHLAALGNDLADALEQRVHSAAHEPQAAEASQRSSSTMWTLDWVSGLGMGVTIGVVLCAGSCVCMAAMKPR